MHLLDIIKYFIGVVVNDVEYINQEFFEDDERKKVDNFTFDLGNGNVIEQEDLESLYSILDTINNIEAYND